MTKTVDSDMGIVPEELINDTEAAISEMQSVRDEYTALAQEAGFGVISLQDAKTNLMVMLNSQENQDVSKGYLNSYHDSMRSLKERLKQYRAEIDTKPDYLRTVAFEAYNTCSTASSVAMTIDVKQAKTPDLPYFMEGDENAAINKLAVIDPALVSTYKEIDQVLYGTTADPDRAALVIERQAFDQFFAKLAPDELVKQSRFWKPKKEMGKEDQVYKRERILYAIHTHIKNPFKANSFVSRLNNILEAYKVLSSFHNRGRININAARQALSTVKQFLKEFALAVD